MDKATEQKWLVDNVQLEMQGDWTKWQGLMAHDTNWHKILYQQGEYLLKFQLNATTETCATPANLRRWGCTQVDPKCPLCHSRIATLAHILNRCSVALNQSRFTWRHDSVLLEIQYLLRPFVNLQSALVKRKGPIKDSPLPALKSSFVKAGQAPKAKSKPASSSSSVFLQASDWQLRFDLHYDEKGVKAQTRFPDEIVVSPLCPDIVIWSNTIRTVIFIELTVPWEENVDKAQLRKGQRYQALEQQCEEHKWHVRRFEIEVGARGYVAPSFTRTWTALGLPPKLRKDLRRNCSDKALLCSYVIYLERFTANWLARKPLNPKRAELGLKQ
jgi:hypothetical protein